jgi:homoserine O-succinyltransferase/O-acetyltransferase
VADTFHFWKMPIITPDGLPVNERLASEGISIMTTSQAHRQDIRPQQIALLNLMPNKQRTEKHLLRLLGDTPLQVEPIFMRTKTYESKTESPEHLATFYEDWESISHRKCDGLIVTGAPVETRPFDKVDYWKELQSIFDWARENVYARLYICWGAQAALHHFHGVEKHELPSKAFGVFEHHTTQWNHLLAKGFDETFSVPVSRHTEIRRSDLEQIPEIQIIAESDKTGVYVAQHESGRDTYIFNHPEYGAKTLKKEHQRDTEKYWESIREGKKDVQFPAFPENYYPDNDPEKCPVHQWRSHARVLFHNWLNQYVYQRSPYDLKNLSDRTTFVHEAEYQI